MNPLKNKTKDQLIEEIEVLQKQVREIEVIENERKQAETILKGYKFIVESAHDAIFFKDLESSYVIANAKTLEIFGLPREEVIGKNDYELMPNQEEAEKAGDFSLTSQYNQAMSYTEEFEQPIPNAGSRKRNELWGFCAAQEYTLISPAFHDEFLLKYQIPIMAHYGLVHYGCCEDLTRKIDMLRQVPNLRSIAVTPRADVKKCADQIGKDYVISWRPNPATMVCANWDPDRVERIIREGADACRDGIFHISLKDIETVEGEPERLQRWTQLVRTIVEDT